MKNNKYPEVVAEWIWSREFTCVLDLADYRDATLEDIAKMFGITRERVRQIETKALNKTKSHKRRKLLVDFKDMVTGREMFPHHTSTDQL